LNLPLCRIAKSAENGAGALCCILVSPAALHKRHQRRCGDFRPQSPLGNNPKPAFCTILHVVDVDDDHDTRHQHQTTSTKCQCTQIRVEHALSCLLLTARLSSIKRRDSSLQPTSRAPLAYSQSSHSTQHTPTRDDLSSFPSFFD
jgi:hypothetical protein